MTVKELLLEITRIVVAELIGTGMLVYFGCMGCMIPLAGPTPIEHIGWVFGLVIMCCLQSFAHISGAHVNPCVTLTANILGHVPWIKFPLYLVSQTVGAVVGFAVLKAVTPSKYFQDRGVDDIGVCSTIPNPKISPFQALGVEMSTTFLLALVCCSVWDHRNSATLDTVPIKIGLTITGLAMASAPYSGGSMNPSRSFAPALINNDWNSHWVYWVGPLAGCAIAATIYRFLFAVPKPEEGEK